MSCMQVTTFQRSSSWNYKRYNCDGHLGCDYVVLYMVTNVSEKHNELNCTVATGMSSFIGVYDNSDIIFTNKTH